MNGVAGMSCVKCSAELTADSRFCAQCGARVPHPCPSCGAPLSGTGACVGCDGNAPAVDLGPAVERRQLTILFYDLVGSTALAVRCDPEDFHAAIDRFHRTIVAAVEPFGARLGARIGDGGIVYFGYPLAHEGAAECAILAGLAAIEAAAALDLPGGGRAQIRVGIATGQSVVGRLDGGNDGNAAVGRVTSLAARLQTVATPGRVIIADSTRRLVGALFDLVDGGIVEAKGFDDPVRAWHVVGRATDDRFAALGAGETLPLIGRADERARLAAAWRRVGPEGAQVVVLSGEAGVGKSHLAAKFVRETDVDADGNPAARVSLFCSPHGQHSPLRPFIVELQRTAARARAAGDDRATPFEPGTSTADAALLLTLIDQRALPDALRDMTPSQRLDRTIDAVIRQAELIAAQRSLLLLFEDAHWVDPTTLRLLDRAVRMTGLRALLVITARPEFRPEWLAAENVEHIELPPLAAADGAALIAQVAGADRLPATLQRAILRRADGMPLFLQELTRSMVEASDAPDADGDARPDLPSTLQDSLLARLDRLGPAKDILQAGAVVGREFSAALLAHLTERSIEQQQGDLDRLIDAGLIQPVNGPAFRFRHVLMQEAAYATLVRADRQRLNGRLLGALEAHGGGPATGPEQLARYADEAGLPGTAAGYWLKAGVAALAQSAMPEALARLRRGLAAVARLDPGDERWRREAALQLALGKALIATNGYAGASILETFTRARTLSEATGDQQQMLAALHGLWVHDLMCARLDHAQIRADELLRIAEERNDPVWMLIGCRAQGVLAYPLGDFARSRFYLERGLQRFAAELRPAYAQILTDDARVVLRVYLSWTLVYLGAWDEARRNRDAAVAEARLLRQPYSLAHALNGRALTMMWMGEYGGVAEVLDELDELTAHHGISYFAVASMIMRGRYLAVAGDLAAGIDRLTRGIDEYRRTHSVLYLPTFLTWLADALGHAGRVAEATAIIAEALAIIDQTGTRNDAVEARRVQATLQRRAGDSAAADASLAGARAMAITQRITPAFSQLGDEVPEPPVRLLA